MSKPNRKPIDVNAFAAAALPQPDPVVTAVAAQKEPPRTVDVEVATEEASLQVPEPREIRAARKAKATASSAFVDTKGRAGKVGLQMWVKPEKRRKLRLYAAGHDRKIDGLLAEALDDLFLKLGID